MRIVKLLFVIICLVTIMIGCSFLGSDEGSDEGADEGDQQLTVLIGQFNDPLSAEIVRIFRDAIEQFEANHPGATVTLDTTTDTTAARFDDMLFSPEVGEEIPDIIVVQPNKLDKYSENQILTDLSTYADHDEIQMSDFYKPLLDSASRDGQWLTIPFAPNPLVVYYNKQWFDEANMAYPDSNWTWEDFSDKAQILQDSRVSSMNKHYGGLLMPDLFLLEPLILSQGGSILSPDGKQATGYLDSDASVRAVQFMIDFVNKQDLVEEINRPTDNYLNHLIRQKTGMIVSSSSALYFLQPELGDQLGIVSLPSFLGGERANPITMLGLSILEQSTDKQLAWDLLKMITLEYNEFTQQWSQWFLVNNISLAKSTGQDVDPFQNVLLDELNYIQKSALELNEYYVNVFIQGSTINGMVNELLTKQSAGEIQGQLTLIANYIDEVMAKSKAEAENKLETQ